MRELSSINYVNSIFQQPWWLDAVAKGQWDEIIIKNNDHIVARMPYVKYRKMGLDFINMPPLTQTLGPWIRESNAKYHNILSFQIRIFNELIDQLPHFDYFNQNFSTDITNWLPFYWRGFEQTTRYTYRIECLQDTDKIWHNFSRNLRTEIRKAQKKLIVRSDLGIDDFLSINNLSFSRQGINFPYSKEFIKNLDKVCSSNNSRIILHAQDAKEIVHSAIYLVGDSKTTYCIMAGSNPDLRTSGANALLIWEALKMLSNHTDIFDFEGTMMKNVERFFRSFGSIQRPYFQITKMSRKMKIYSHSKAIIKALAGY